MSTRAGLRFLNTFRQTAFRRNLTQTQRRTYADAADNVAAPPAQSKAAALWNSPVGPKTVHFWAPIMKWGLVLAGAADFARPAESLSLSQNAALTTTGMIWTRWCFVIRPQNLFLASVNFMLAGVGITQVCRILAYQSSQKGDSVVDEAVAGVKAEGKRIEDIVKDPKRAIQNAEKA